MKKKILLFAMLIAVLSCLFAFVAGAESVKVDSTSIDMTISFYDANGNEVKATKKVDELFNVNFKNDGSEYYFKLTGVKSWDVDVNGTSYSIRKQLAGLYLPEGITHVPSVGDGYWGFTAATADNVRKLHLPESLESLGGNFLRGIGHVKLVNEDDTYDNYLPQSLTTVNDHLFCNWTVYNEVLYFPEGFHNIGSDAGTKWNLEGFSQVNKKITFVFFGEMTFIDVDNREDHFTPTFVFAKNTASDLWGYALPMVEGSTTVAITASYVNNTNPDQQTLKLFWYDRDGINASMDKGKQTATMGANAPRLIFCGSDTVEYVMSVRFCTGSSYPALYDSNGTALNAKGISGYGSNNWMRFYTTPITFDIDAHKTANVHYDSIVYQAGNCGYDEATTTTCVICKLQSVIIGALATGEHTYTDDLNCETALNCEVCKKTLVEALTHDSAVTVVYANGYTDKGERTTTCKHEGCNVNVVAELNPIFSFKGISTKISDTVVGITFGYNIDKVALGEYEAANGKLQHGFVVSFASLLGNNAPIVNGEAASIDGCNIIMADSSKNDYTATDFILKGAKSVWENEQILVNGEALKNAKLILACYTIDTSNNVTYFNYDSSDNAFGFAKAYSEIN